VQFKHFDVSAIKVTNWPEQTFADGDAFTEK